MNWTNSPHNSKAIATIIEIKSHQDFLKLKQPQVNRSKRTFESRLNDAFRKTGEAINQTNLREAFRDSDIDYC